MPTLDEYARIPLSDLAKLLTEAAGQRVTVSKLRADLAAGAPSNPDGIINLVHYVAWLLSQRRAERIR